MGVAATLFGVQHLKGIEQRRSGAAQWLPGPRSIGQKDFPFRTIKLLLLLLLLCCYGNGVTGKQVFGENIIISMKIKGKTPSLLSKFIDWKMLYQLKSKQNEL